MTDKANKALDRLDERISHLQKALEARDWDLLTELNGNIRELVDPVMTALEQQELSATEVQQRLHALEAFVREAGAEAREARHEAREALEQVGQNRKAASAYARVSGRDK